MKRITPQDVGRRVSVRRVLEDGSPPVLGDVVGELTEWADGVLAITRRDGSTARVSEAAIVAGKVVPPPAQRLDAGRLQRLADEAWPAPDRAETAGWLLRAAGGFTRRANSALPAGPADAAVSPESLRLLGAWYADRGLPALAQVVCGDPVDGALAAAGWTAQAETLVLTGRLSRAAAALAGADPSGVVVRTALDDAWLARYRRVEGPVSDVVRRVVTGPPGTVFAAVPGAFGGDAAGVPVAIGRASVRGRFAGFSAVEVDPALRRRGVARAVMRALTDAALTAGAATGWLQVEAGNEPAVRLYESLGFTVHHRYHYRVEPGT